MATPTKQAKVNHESQDIPSVYQQTHDSVCNINDSKEEGGMNDVNSACKLSQVIAVNQESVADFRDDHDDDQSIYEEQPSKVYEREIFVRLDDTEVVVKSFRKHIQVIDKVDPHVFPSNLTRTALYTRLNLFPRAFFLQFTKLANLYWAICACLQFYKPIRTASPVIVLFFLLFVVCIGVLKEWASDSKRQQADREVNNRVYRRVTALDPHQASIKNLAIAEGGCTTVKSMNIRVGDLMWLQDDQIIPVDCVVLQTSMSDGSCMISTGQLDGERVLKPKYALEETQADLASLVASSKKGISRFSIKCAEPDADLFYFDGLAEIVGADDQRSHKNMNIGQFLPMGAILHNTGGAGILVAAVYTGRDSKLIMNQGALKYKASNTEKTLNRIYVIQAISVTVLAIILGLLGYRFLNANRD